MWGKVKNNEKMMLWIFTELCRVMLIENIKRMLSIMLKYERLMNEEKIKIKPKIRTKNI